MRQVNSPVKAVGHNFHFLCKSREEWRAVSPLPALGNRRSEDFKRLEQCRWTGVFQSDGVRIELTVGEAEDGVVVLMNHHRATNGLEEAVAAARQFLDDREVSRTLLREMLKQELKQIDGRQQKRFGTSPSP